MRSSLVDGCVASAYPRSLSSILSPSEAQLLSRIYFDHVAKFSLRYYGLLHFLGHAQPEDYERAMSVLRRLQARVARAFG